jgi:iron complex transport system permease protein
MKQMTETTATESIKDRTRDGQTDTRATAVIAGLIITLGVLIVLSLHLGRYPVSVWEIIHILLTSSPINATGQYSNAQWVVVEIVRIPRILIVTLCGMGLSLSGAAMQGLFRNPLVGPEIAGVSAGASFGGVLAIMLSLPFLGIVALAFGCGMGALALAFSLAKVSGRGSTLALVLSGVIVGAFFGTGSGVLQALATSTSKIEAIVYWMLGSFKDATYQRLSVVAGIILVAGTLLLKLRWRINLLSLGMDDAAALGVNVEALRWTILALVSMIVAAQVSVSGNVGWVGLIIPHLARMLVGPEHTKLLPASAFLGGVYLLGVDDLARTVSREEIPIGLLTGVIGAPIFAYMFWKTKGKGWQSD